MAYLYGRNRQRVVDKHSPIDDSIVILEYARIRAGIIEISVDPKPREKR